MGMPHPGLLLILAGAHPFALRIPCMRWNTILFNRVRLYH